MTSSQRMGLGFVALFYGELVAVPLFMLAVLLRFHSNWYMFVRVPGATISYLLTVALFEALIAAITWMIFGSALVGLWPPESMRRHVQLAYASAVALALLAAGLLGSSLYFIHRKDLRTPLMGRALFLETSGFMLVCSVAAIFWYFRLSAKAETLLEVKEELGSRQLE